MFAFKTEQLIAFRATLTTEHWLCRLANGLSKAAEHLIELAKTSSWVSHKACYKKKAIGYLVHGDYNRTVKYLRIYHAAHFKHLAAPSCETAVRTSVTIQRTCSTIVWNCSVSKAYLCIQKQHQRAKLRHTNILRIKWTNVPACPENIAEQSAYPATTAVCTSLWQNIPVYSCIWSPCVFEKKKMLCTCVFTKRNCIQRTCSTHVVKLQMHPTIHIEYEIVSIKHLCLVVLHHLTLPTQLCLYTLQYQSIFSYSENL